MSAGNHDEIIKPEYKVTIEEKDEQVFIYKPRCPVCDANMIEGIFEYYRDANDNIGIDKYGISSASSFLPNRMYRKLLYCCKIHKDKQVLVTPDQLGIINQYVKARQQFMTYPRPRNH